MPTSKLATPATTGTHTGKEGGHSITGLGVVTGGLGRLLMLVKMKGLTYRKRDTNQSRHLRNEELNESLSCTQALYPKLLKIHTSDQGLIQYI